MDIETKTYNISELICIFPSSDVSIILKENNVSSVMIEIIVISSFRVATKMVLPDSKRKDIIDSELMTLTRLYAIQKQTIRKYSNVIVKLSDYFFDQIYHQFKIYSSINNIFALVHGKNIIVSITGLRETQT